MAVGTGITPVAANDMAISTTATLECAAQVRAAAMITSKPMWLERS